MPILINNATANTNNIEQQDQMYNPDDSPSDDKQINHAPQTEPEVDLLKLLDEPGQINGTVHQHEQKQTTFPTSDPLAEFMFGNDVPNNHLQTNIPSMVALDRNGLRIAFTFERHGTSLTIHSKATNSTQYPMTNFVFKAAVPKTFTIELLPPNSTTVPRSNSGELHQIIKVSNPNKEKLRMRIKLNYLVNNTPMSDEAELNSFPEQCYN